MNLKQFYLGIIAGAMMLYPAMVKAAEVSFSPQGISAALDSADAENDVNDTLLTSITVSNTTDTDIAYKFKVRRVHRDEGRDGGVGPRRDNPGDLVAEFQGPNQQNSYVNPCGWDVDNERLWITSYSQSAFWSYTHNADYSEFERIGAFQQASAMYGGFTNGFLYIYTWGGQTLTKYDADGQNLNEQINLGFVCYGVSADVENNRLVVQDSGFNIHIIQLDDDGDVVEEVGRIAQANHAQYHNNTNVYNVCWVEAHDEGKLWMVQGANIYQIAVNEENWEATGAVQNFDVRGTQQYDGAAHDGEHLWVGGYGNANIRIYDDGNEETGWIQFTPNEGVLDAGSDTEIDVLITSSLDDPGFTEREIVLMLDTPDQGGRDIELPASISMSALLSIDRPVANLVGTVTRADNHAAIEGVTVTNDYFNYVRQTDADGNFALPNFPIRDYTLTYTFPDMLTHTQDVALDTAGDHDCSFEMLHATCLPDEHADHFVLGIEPDMTYNIDFSVSNDGTGPLTYRVDRRLIGEANAEPWTLRHESDIETVVDNDLVYGVVFVDGNYYVSGGSGEVDGVGKIYVLNTDGELVRSFDQFSVSRSGMKALTWDGELIWGGDGAHIYGFDLEGTLQRDFAVRPQQATAVAWDPENEVIWVSPANGTAYSYTRDGQVGQSILRPGDLSVQSMCWFPDDADGFNMYMLCMGGDEIASNVVVARRNMNNGDWELVQDLHPEGEDKPRGMFITDQIDVYSWVMLGVVGHLGDDIPHRLQTYQVEARKSWMAVTPNAGVIDAGSSSNFVFTFNTTGLPDNTRFLGTVVFVHDGVGGETPIDVLLDVVQGGVQTERRVNLRPGWNLVSTNLVPNDTDIPTIMADQIEDGSLVLMKNGVGDFFWPAHEFNQIEGWEVTEGYLVKMTDARTLLMHGISMYRDDEIPLSAGWQYVAYYPNFGIEATFALGGIESELVICKDGDGNFYVPGWNFSNMGDLRTGQGYQMLMSEDVTLVYRNGIDEMGGNPDNGGWRQLSAYNQPKLTLPLHNPTGRNHSLLVMADKELTGEIGVYTGETLVGSGWLENGAAGVAVWGDDPTTVEIDGAVEGSDLSVRLVNAGGSKLVTFQTLEGKAQYATDGFTVIRIEGTAAMPVQFGLLSAHPNPFNAATRISYGLTETAVVKLSLYDLLGREVAQLQNGSMAAGRHEVSFDAAKLSSGLYVARLEAGGQVSRLKLTLVK